MIALFQILVATAICIYGILLLIRLLNKMEKDILESWLGFLKFFLGTFVIGLLGFFAKLSYENRQMAVTESEQIGKYVENAMLNDIESRLRFAEYFSTVLPEGHTTGWENYYEKLRLEDSLKREAEKLKEATIQEMNELQQKSEDIVKDGDSLSKEDLEILAANAKKLNKLYVDVEDIQKKIEKGGSLSNASKNSASNSTPDDFVTCKKVENLMPYSRTSTFKVNEKVYVHAFVQAPKSESVAIIWKDTQGKEWNRTVTNVGVNTGRGYRLYDHVRPKKAGEYSVEMRNQANQVIGFKTFIVK
ncbi:MAG: hypothetical protein KJO73_03575 [Croceitalea sp.]|nr:hypothetical protein [Croceitalea sp.]